MTDWVGISLLMGIAFCMGGFFEGWMQQREEEAKRRDDVQRNRHGQG